MPVEPERRYELEISGWRARCRCLQLLATPVIRFLFRSSSKTIDKMVSFSPYPTASTWSTPEGWREEGARWLSEG